MNTPKNFRNLIGQTFGQLTVAGRAPNGANWRVYWQCQCSCGQQANVRSDALLKGATKSCGCWNVQAIKNRQITHGHSRTNIHYMRVCMKQRCSNPNNPGYKDYGGRGITVCEEWKNDFKSFYDWAIANGYAIGLQLDRYPDNDGPYAPWNCRYTTAAMNSRNKRTNIKIMHNGQEYCLTDLAQQFGIKPNTAVGRILRQGWSPILACTTPTRR